MVALSRNRAERARPLLTQSPSDATLAGSLHPRADLSAGSSEDPVADAPVLEPTTGEALALEALLYKARLEGALLATRTAEHELGNRLAAARARLQLLGRSGALGTDEQRHLTRALHDIDRATVLLHGLRGLVGGAEVDWGPVGGTTIRVEHHDITVNPA